MRIIIINLLAAFVLGLAGWLAQTSLLEAAGERLPVTATFYPLAEFSRQVGGDRVMVRTLVPARVEPHDYEPTPRDLVELARARVVVYNGAGFEPWLRRLLPTLPRVVRVDSTAGLVLARSTAGGPRATTDPHVWLDPILAQHQTERILAGLIAADPAGRAVYEGSARSFARRLAALHERNVRTLAPCRKKVFVVSHAAFGYFATRYGLTQIAISGVSPQEEPSAAKIREVLRLVRRHGLQVIYYETLVSPRVAATIAREVGARTLVLNPIEGLTTAEQQQGKTYLSIMEENLRALVAGLDCP